MPVALLRVLSLYLECGLGDGHKEKSMDIGRDSEVLSRCRPRF